MKITTKILIVLTALWMLLIFIMSAQSVKTSSEVSNRVTAAIVETMYGDKTPSNPEDIGWEGTATWVYEDLESGLVPKDDIWGRSKLWFKNDVRKLAHILIYLVLAILVNITFISHFQRNKTVCVILTAVFCTLYAISDEIHQYFVPGRGMEIKDVVIDCIGVLTGIIFVAVICAVIRLVKILISKSKKTA